MSQLTTNTTTIDECIALANSLPDAGCGGGGSGGGTCTVELLANGPIASSITFDYINADGVLDVESCSNMDLMMGVQLVVQSNTPIASISSISSAAEPEGGAIKINQYCYHITGDATIYIGG